MPVQTRKVKPDEEGMRLDRWFKAHFPDLTFAHLQKLLRTGQVRVDGGRAKTNTRLEPGMAVRVPPLTRSEPVRKRPAAPARKRPASALPRERPRRWATPDPTPHS
jgi:23S rRNA pseudouridine955/2504/2580 synthase